jgi:predicted glycosyltransferase involved in capsule biosynthesis
MIRPNETVAIGWCDNGTTDGKFTEGLTTAIIAGAPNGMIINTSIRVQGNQIGRQRQVLFDHWADKLKTDWLLWVDSDIVLNLDSMKLLWQTADKINKPVVSGVYFISKENEGTLMRPFPVLFDNVSEFQIKYHHPLPENQVLKVDCAGFGFVLMHKSIVPKMREANPGKGMFMETGDGQDDHFIGEDIIFFRRMAKAGIPLHAHTGAIVKHMKRFSLDYDYYALYWANEHLKEKLKEQQQQGE